MNRPGFFYQPHTDARSRLEMRRFFDEIFAVVRLPLDTTIRALHSPDRVDRPS